MIRAALQLAAARPAVDPRAGARLGTLPGCRGPYLTGHMIVDDPAIATLWSANVTRVVQPDGSDL